MRLDERRNPQPTEFLEWLRKQVEIYQPALLVLDTKARLFGLDENSNDHASQWVSALESLLPTNPELTFLAASHASKGAVSAGDTGQHSTRGASALTDNARFVLSLTALGDEEAKKIGGNARDFVRLVHAKPNYARPADPALFKRGPHGVLLPFDEHLARHDRFGEAAGRLVETLASEYPGGISASLLRRARNDKDGYQVKDLRDECLDGLGIKAEDWPIVIEHGLESGKLETVVDESSDSNNKPELIRVKNSISTCESTCKVSTCGNLQEMTLQAKKNEKTTSSSLQVIQLADSIPAGSKQRENNGLPA